MTSGFLRIAIVLGLISAIGPFAIDMYLPALPTIGADLGASPLAVQMSLVVVFLSFAIGPLLVGPLADMYGRKPVMYGGLVVFAIASVGAALAPDVEWLIFFRLLQGLGSSTGMVVPRAIVRDLHTGAEATKLMSLLMLVFSVSPILAPLTGSFIIEAFGWRAVFWAVTIAAVLAFLLMIFGLEETRPAEHRGGSSFAGAWRGYKFLLRDRTFVGLSLIGGFGIASFFVYLANSSFVIIDHYGFSPSAYSLFFAVNAVSFFGVSQMSGWLTAKYGLHRVVRPAVFGFAAVILAGWAMMAAGVESIALMTVTLFVANGFLGLVIPTTSVLAMEEHGEIAGTAAALMGTLHMVTGVVAMTVVGHLRQRAAAADGDRHSGLRCNRAVLDAGDAEARRGGRRPRCRGVKRQRPKCKRPEYAPAFLLSGVLCPVGHFDAHLRDHEICAVRYGSARQFHEFIAQLGIGLGHYVVGPDGDVPALPALFVPAVDFLPWRRDENALVVAEAQGFLFHPGRNVQAFEPEIADRVRKAAIEENETVLPLRVAVGPQLPFEHLLGETLAVDPGQGVAAALQLLRGSRRGRPLRSSHSHAPSALRSASSCRSPGRR